MSKSKKSSRMKSTARAYVPQDKDQCAQDITTIGVLQREIARTTSEMNDEISKVAQKYQPLLEAHQTRLTELQRGVQTWCEANRAALTLSGKVKFHNMVTGIVGWRARPASVTVTGAEEVIKLLKAAGLTTLVRVKEEVNKDAILDSPSAVDGVKGIRINSGIEDFYIEPVELQAPVAQPEVV